MTGLPKRFVGCRSSFQTPAVRRGQHLGTFPYKRRDIGIFLNFPHGLADIKAPLAAYINRRYVIFRSVKGAHGLERRNYRDLVLHAASAEENTNVYFQAKSSCRALPLIIVGKIVFKQDDARLARAERIRQRHGLLHRLRRFYKLLRKARAQ